MRHKCLSEDTERLPVALSPVTLSPAFDNIPACVILNFLEFALLLMFLTLIQRRVRQGIPTPCRQYYQCDWQEYIRCQNFSRFNLHSSNTHTEKPAGEKRKTYSIYCSKKLQCLKMYPTQVILATKYISIFFTKSQELLPRNDKQKK